jgi:hypothetical protein
MRLLVDVSQVHFTVTRAAAEKMDENGRQKTNRRTNEPLWTVQVMALDGSGGEMLSITVAGVPPKVKVGEAVLPIELEAIPWAQGGRNGVAFRAVSVNAVTASKASAA